MERFYRRLFQTLPIRQVEADEHLHLLSAGELRLVRRTERLMLAAAVLIELAAYLIIFVPIYEFPGLFESGPIQIGGPFPATLGPADWVRQIWMLAVTLVELYFLMFANLAAVHGIAVATGYVRRESRATHAPGLIRIALEKHFHEQRQFGIDPFEGMWPGALYAYLVFNRLKGLIGSVLVRAALTNLFGREILRVYLDFSGMPIYMAINLYTTRAILLNARVVIMGQTSIDIIRQRLPRLQLSPWEQCLVYDTLQFIAVNKRDYHANHLHLTRVIFDHFGIPIEPSHPLPGDYPAKLQQARRPVADLCRLVIVLGFLLDGRLSGRERRQIDRLRNAGLLDLGYPELQRYCRNFVDGQGLAEACDRFLGWKN